MSALIAALLSYFPHGLPADDAQAREMVRQALIQHETAKGAYA